MGEARQVRFGTNKTVKVGTDETVEARFWNSAQIRQSKPDYGLGSSHAHAIVLKPFYVLPFSLGNGPLEARTGTISRMWLLSLYRSRAVLADAYLLASLQVDAGG